MKKKSYKMYRNIDGTNFIHWTSDPSYFEDSKKECKKNKLKFRIINKELFVENKVIEL